MWNPPVLLGSILEERFVFQPEIIAKLMASVLEIRTNISDCNGTNGNWVSQIFGINSYFLGRKVRFCFFNLCEVILFVLLLFLHNSGQPESQFQKDS
jgi:hypothetical protein